MLEICYRVKKELMFIINKNCICTYFPVWKPAEYQAFKTAARSVSEPLISVCSKLFLSFPELYVEQTQLCVYHIHPENRDSNEVMPHL